MVSQSPIYMRLTNGNVNTRDKTKWDPKLKDQYAEHRALSSASLNEIPFLIHTHQDNALINESQKLTAIQFITNWESLLIVSNS